jgi:hypothetical protein
MTQKKIKQIILDSIQDLQNSSNKKVKSIVKKLKKANNKL